MTEADASSLGAGELLVRARAAKAELQARYGSDARLRGIGIEARPDGFGLRVLVADAATAAHLAVPDEVGGLPTTVVVIGDVRAQS